jgi:signal transduction histidine kinase
MSEKSVERLPELIEAAAGVVGEVDLERVLKRLVTEAAQATGARYGALGVLGEHGILTEFRYTGLTDEEAALIGAPPSGRGVLGTVIRENRTIVLDDISQHPDSYGFPPDHPTMTSFLGVPVSVGGRAFGNLYLTDKPGGFTDDDIALVEALSRIAGSAVHTASLQERFRGLAVVEDRQRIARDLHDSVIQDLFAVGLGLQGVAERVQETPAAATLDDAVDRLDAAVEALRTYIFHLKVTQDSHGLDDRLQELVSRMGSAYPSTVRLELDIRVDIEDPDLEDQIFKIVTEALSNALRHSEARDVDVKVETSDAELLVQVTDNGVGFDPGQPTSGMGLANIKTRVERLGGSMSLRSEPGSGSIVEIRAPMG